ncbi:hypothetical protein ABZV34_14410 [Streptomyces sp. NPDC005195]|uniref:hypothetical protein n=1 Tax=Streptomyces sp. NPDC005195 TaxID=3154561 RepID=UPI00339F74C2
MGGQDEVHWNAETQSWETGGAPQGRYTPPPPPRPGSEPVHPPGPVPVSGPAPAPGPAPVPGPGDGPGSADDSGSGSGSTTGADSGFDQRSQYPAPALFPGPDQGGYYPAHPAYATPGPPPPPPPGPASRPSARRVATVLTAALLVGGAAGFGGWYVWGGDSGGTHKDAGTKVSTAPTGPSAQEPTPAPSSASTPAPTLDATSASPSASAVPAGYHRASNGEFGMAVPDGWQPETQNGKNGVTIYFFRESGGGPRYLQVFRVSEDDPTPRGTLTVAEKDLRKQLPGYHRNSLRTVPDARGEAAELDYSHPSQKWGVDVRTLDRVLPAGGGELYVVLTSGPADAWPEQQQIQGAAVTSFCLAGVC